jgi:hypothetical protein
MTDERENIEKPGLSPVNMDVLVGGVSELAEE